MTRKELEEYLNFVQGEIDKFKMVNLKRQHTDK